MTEYFIAWWNLENLFDAEDNPNRERKVARAVGSDLKDWDQEKLDKKIAQLASVLKDMNKDSEGVSRGPDLMGLCEVENERVLELLVKAIGLPERDYEIDLIEGPDKRGIDVAFIYDKKKFAPHIVDNEYIFSHEVVKRSPTRDILQVNLATVEKPGEPIVFVGNHWYARTSGVYESEPYRIIAAETLSYWLSRINEIHGDGGWVPVVVMGDFNDLPWERALVEYALSTRVASEVKNARSKPWLFNLMWPFVGVSGSYYYDNEPLMLDQFLVTKGFFEGESKFTYDPASVKIIAEANMMDNGQPRRFGLPAKSTYDEDGYSDHFPISMVIKQE